MGGDSLPFTQMKRLNFIVILLLLTQALWGQENEQAIRTDVSNYFSLLQEEKISEALDYVHPDLLAIVGKEMFQQQYNAMLNNAEMEVSFGDLVIEKVSEIYTSSEKGDFALVDYKFEMDYVINLENEVARNLMVKSLKAQFGEDGFTQDGKNVQVSANRQMFVNSRTDFEGWRILDYEAGMRIMLVGIISEEVLKHFGK